MFVLSVQDEGMGIPKNKLNYIYDRFYQVDKSRSSKISTVTKKSVTAKELSPIRATSKKSVTVPYASPIALTWMPIGKDLTYASSCKV